MPVISHSNGFTIICQAPREHEKKEGKKVGGKEGRKKMQARGPCTLRLSAFFRGKNLQCPGADSADTHSTLPLQEVKIVVNLYLQCPII